MGDKMGNEKKENIDTEKNVNDILNELRTKEEVKTIKEEKDEINEETITSTGFVRVLEILANKASRKAVVIMTAMILIYLLAATPSVTQILISVIAICLLSILFTILQYRIDRKRENTTRDKDG